jgi:hypothetical protein
MQLLLELHFAGLCIGAIHLHQCVATLALGLQPSQKGYKVVGQEEARESKQRGRKGARQEEA